MHRRASLFLFELDLFYVVALRSLLLQCLLYGSSGHLVRARSSVLSVYQRIFGIVGVAALTARRRASRRQHTFQHRPAVVLSGDEKGNGTRDHHQHQHNSRCQLTRTCSVRHGTHTQIQEQCDSRASRAKPQSGGVPSWLSLLVFVCSKMATSAQMYVHNMPRSM